MDKVQVAEFAAEEALKATLQAIDPNLGHLGSALVDLRRSRLLPRWLTFVNERLRSSSVTIDSQEERMEALFNRLTIAALQTSRNEKWELLAEVLISANTTAWIDSDFVVDHFADLVVRFSPEHVLVLRHLSKLSPEDEPSPEQILEALAPGLTDDDRVGLLLVLDSVMSDLTSAGLIGHGFGKGNMNTTDHGDGTFSIDTSWAISSKGRRFLEYLESS